MPETISIRPATPADIDAVRDLWRASFAAGELPGLDAPYLDRLADRLAVAGTGVLVAAESGGIAGAIDPEAHLLVVRPTAPAPGRRSPVGRGRRACPRGRRIPVVALVAGRQRRRSPFPRRARLSLRLQPVAARSAAGLARCAAVVPGRGAPSDGRPNRPRRLRRPLQRGIRRPPHPAPRDAGRGRMGARAAGVRSAQRPRSGRVHERARGRVLPRQRRRARTRQRRDRLRRPHPGVSRARHRPRAAALGRRSACSPPARRNFSSRWKARMRPRCGSIAARDSSSPTNGAAGPGPDSTHRRHDRGPTLRRL